MNYAPGDTLVYKTMLGSFRLSDLQALLEAFNCNILGRKSELLDRALELLSCRNTNTGINYNAYQAKITELYYGLLRCKIVRLEQQPMDTQSTSMQAQHQRIFQYSQQSYQAGLPQMQQTQEYICGNNNTQCSYQDADHDHVNTEMINQLGVEQFTSSHAPTPTNKSSFENLTYINFIKLPFYDVLFEILKPEILVGHERCSLSNPPKGMREANFDLRMTLDHINAISLTRDISKVPFIYIHQVQIRICAVEHETTKTKDFLPLGLIIRVFNNICLLPPIANNKPGVECRRIPGPINCTNFIKLNPNNINTLTVNWIPDNKTYAIGVWIVKELDLDSMLHKLKVNGARRTEETKNYIIQKFANVDPDLATTSYRVSLICPLGKMRMNLPVKSVNCDHLQCFDASTFILMNEKKPKWLCPTCNKSCLYDDIVIESYFLDIVSNPYLPDSSNEIEILPDGTWLIYEPNNEIIDMASASKNNLVESLYLDVGDHKYASELKKNPSEVTEPTPKISLKKNENMKFTYIDLTVSDVDEELSKEKNYQENEAQAVNAVQPMTAVNLKPQVQAQPKQAVTSSEQVMMIELD